MLGAESPVLAFMDTIRSFGGHYEPFRDWGERPEVITGRRAIPRPLYALRLRVNGVEKYRRDPKTGTIRRTA